MYSKYYFLLLTLSFFACNRQAAPNNSLWLSTKPAINGDIMDWGQNLVNSTEKTELQCFIANDSQNIYIGVRIPDPIIQAKAMKMGMTIWVDTLGKQKHHRGIGFPIAPSDKQWEEWITEARGERILLENLYAKKCDEFDLVGFVEEALRVTNFTSRDMKVSASFDAIRTLVYELKIPISQLIKRNAMNAILNFHVRINDPKTTLDDDTGTLNDPNANSITQSNPLMGGGMNGNNGGMNGGGMNGGMNTGGMNNNGMNGSGMSNPNMASGGNNQRFAGIPGNYAPNVWARVQLTNGGN